MLIFQLFGENFHLFGNRINLFKDMVSLGAIRDHDASTQTNIFYYIRNYFSATTKLTPLHPNSCKKYPLKSNMVIISKLSKCIEEKSAIINKQTKEGRKEGINRKLLGG